MILTLLLNVLFTIFLVKMNPLVKSKAFRTSETASTHSVIKGAKVAPKFASGGQGNELRMSGPPLKMLINLLRL